jgi:hypothetical protein
MGASCPFHGCFISRVTDYGFFKIMLKIIAGAGYYTGEKMLPPQV